MTATLAFTLSDMLIFIIVSLLVGAFFGIWIAREVRTYVNGPTIGAVINRRIVGGRIVCDGCGRKTPYASSENDARRDARNQGWAFGKRDLCPDCTNAEPSTGAETHSEN